MNPINDVIGIVLVHFVWQGALLAAMAALMLYLLRHAQPSARYLASCVMLSLMVAAPAATAAYMTRLSSPAAASVTALARGAESRSAATAAGPARLAGVDVMPDALPWVAGLWAVGVVVLLARLGRGWRRVRAVHRRSLAVAPSRWQPVAERLAARLGVARAIRTVDSLSAHSPAVIGWLRPVIVLPVSALASLTPTQVEAILAHELAHIRRHDFAVNLLQTLAETLLFYHPGVWWLSERIRTEREHCCDAVAVETCGDAVAYADALTELATWRMAGPQLAVTATGGALLDRIRRVLGAVPARRPRPAAPLSVGAPLAVTALLAVILVAGSVRIIAVRQPASDSGTPVTWRMVFDHPTGELTLKGYTGRDLIRLAYNVPQARVIGGPSWLDDQSMDLSTTLDADPGADGIQGVVRQLLESRMGLTVTVESRDFPAYALVDVTPPGGAPGLQPATAECVDVQAWLAAGNALSHFGDRRPCGSWRGSRATIHGVRVTMPDLARELESGFRESLEYLDVIDRTNLTGEFDLTLRMPPLLAIARRFHIPGVVQPGISFLPGEMQEQLGLTIERTLAPYDVIVVGNIHRIED